ncbi:MAG: hypothetical protein ABEI39_01225 [Halobacteriales archaeon]
MLRRLRETAPAALVPLAWTVVAAAHGGLLDRRPLLIAHLVMVALLVAFVVLSWSDMRSGVLLAWRRVILAGIPVTAAGAAGLAATPPITALLWVAVVGWMVLPAAGLLHTGRRADTLPGAYLGGGLLSALGALVYVLAPVAGGTAALAGLAFVGAGQTIGILAAAAT